MILKTIEYVGLLELLGIGKPRPGLLSNIAGIVSPWADSDGILKTVTTDIFPFDFEYAPLLRDQAITIPAVSKARNLLIATICKMPLFALNSTGPLEPDKQPTFLYRTNGVVSAQERLAWTLDDLIFYGFSLWLVERGAGDQITEAYWVPTSDWEIDPDNKLLINGKPVDEHKVILFNSPFEGLLTVGRVTLRGARDTERAWTKRMESPAYMTELRITDDSNMTQEEVDAWLSSWQRRHSASSPSVGLTPAGMELYTHQGALGEGDLFIANRNAVRTDVGSFLNIRASMLDGTAGIDSLTYSTTEGEHNSFYEFDLPFWTDPIEWRLSQDDVVPRGTRVRFDRTAEYKGSSQPTNPPVED